MAQDISGPNPSGLCMCGCGGEAPIAMQNDKRYGIVKGQPQRYIKGHCKFKSPANEPYIIDPETGCWIWQRAVNSSGYGHLYVNGVHKYAHVHYYEQANGVECESGRSLWATQVHHRCGNKRCVNPEHLEAVGCIEHRHEHGIAKLTASNVVAIRNLYKRGFTQHAIADMYNMTQGPIGAAVRRDSWKHVD